MNPLIVTGLLEAGKKLIDKWFPDAESKAKAELELYRMQQAGEFREVESMLASDKAQTDINAKEAENPSVFVSGWRPAVGWVCVAGLAYSFVIRPFLAWGALFYDKPEPPTLDLEQLIGLLFGLLGLGYYRMREKMAGVARIR